MENMKNIHRPEAEIQTTKVAESGKMRGFVTSSKVLRKVSLQTKLNAGLSKQQQEDLF